MVKEQWKSDVLNPKRLNEGERIVSNVSKKTETTNASPIISVKTDNNALLAN